jgi:hypothetical protein
MIISSNFFQFDNFLLSLLQFSIFFGKILDYFELQKFWTNHTKAMAEDEKVNVAVTYG